MNDQFIAATILFSNLIFLLDDEKVSAGLSDPAFCSPYILHRLGTDPAIATISCRISKRYLFQSDFSVTDNILSNLLQLSRTICKNTNSYCKNILFKILTGLFDSMPKIKDELFSRGYR